MCGKKGEWYVFSIILSAIKNAFSTAPSSLFMFKFLPSKIAVKTFSWSSVDSNWLSFSQIAESAFLPFIAAHVFSAITTTLSVLDNLTVQLLLPDSANFLTLSPIVITSITPFTFFASAASKLFNF